MANLQLQIKEDTELRPVLLQELSRAKTDLKQHEQLKARGWYKRAKIKCAAEGDLPSKFFYCKLKQNRKHNFIPPMPDENGEVQQGADLVELVKRHYGAFLTGEPTRMVLSANCLGKQTICCWPSSQCAAPWRLRWQS